jgi:hypothetical protein
MARLSHYFPNFGEVGWIFLEIKALSCIIEE